MAIRQKARVLIVDDAVVIRRIVTDVLAADPQIDVVGTAANGRIALQKIPQVSPDLVTLDIEMPEMDGLATLREIRRLYPKLPVIMFSTLTARGAEATLDALTLGASDYVTKPANVGSVATAQQRVRDELIPKIKSLCQVGSAAPVATRPTAAAIAPPPAPRAGAVVVPLPAGAQATTGEIDIVAIGVSTGGPNALAAILPLLPGDLRVPVVIVQHMPPMFTKFLAERLDRQADLTVVEATAGEVLRPGVVYVAPGNFHLVLDRRGQRTFTGLNQDAPENSCRPAVDVLFRSVAGLFGSRALGVILTGMGQDGLRGCEDLRRAGSPVFVQDEETSIVWGMPGFVARAGLAERVIPLPAIASEITRRVAVRDQPPVALVSVGPRAAVTRIS